MAPGWVVVLLLVSGSSASESSQSCNVSQKCIEDINTFLWEINHDKPKEYAVLMYDSFGKMGSNVEGGNVNQPGLLQQCRLAIGPSFSGQYCQVFLKQGALQYFVGICVPDSCGEEDVKELVLYDRLQFNQMSLIPPLPPILTNESRQDMIMTHCLANRTELDASDVVSIFVCCAMIAVPLAATLFTAMVRSERSGPDSPNVQFSHLNSGPNVYGALKTSDSSSREMNGSAGENDGPSPEQISQSCAFECLQAFSLQTNCRGIFSTSSSSILVGSFSSLNGIRVLSLLWIICGHSTQFPVINNLDNYKNWRGTVENNPVYIFTISGPVFLAVDTFLLLGGLLSARSLLRSIDKAGDKLTLSLVANYLFKRIKRIQPLHMFTMCLTISLISLVQWGPYWFPFMDTMMDCKAYWWANLLLISNLLPFHNVPLDVVLVFRLPVLHHNSSADLFVQIQTTCVCSCSWRPPADVDLDQRRYNSTPAPTGLSTIYNDIRKLCSALLCETIHKIWTISNRDPNRNSPGNKEGPAVKAKVAGSAWMVVQSVSDGLIGWICLLPEGDPYLSISASCCVSGATPAGLGPDCELDHTSL
ncbi:O-acyltransferase like protein isoform X3 [Nothobranchius furzeri]|uniref:O-acyltransferase like protein isoform X3 n=1 Tax=Nothobranchius furzeri TaxID=105023 RepID=UPI0039049E8C